MSSLNSRRIQAGRCCFQQQRGGRDRRLQTHPQRRGELESTAIEDAYTSPSLLQSSMYDVSVTGLDRGPFPTSKPMKSYARPLDERPQFNSPAKIFAKLKASVGRNTGGMQAGEKDVSVFLTPRKGAANTREAKWMMNETRTVDPIGAEATTISPSKSPQHKPVTRSFRHRTQYRVPSPVRETRYELMERNEYTPVKNPGEVTPQVPLSHKATHSRSSKSVFGTRAIGQPQQLSNYEIGGRPIIDVTVGLEKCPSMSPAKMFAYFKRRESKRAFPFPQKTAHGKKDVCMELSDDESQGFFSAKLSKSDPRSIDEPTNSPVGNVVTDDLSPPARCPVVLNNLWLHDSEKALLSKRQGLISLENRMPPAKTHMQERKRQQPQEADDVGRSTREAGNGVPSRKMPASTDLKRLEVEYGIGMDAFDRLPGSEDNRFQSEAAFERCRKDDPPIPARQPLLVLAEDPLVNQSPCVSIPKKHKSIFNWNPAPLEPIQPKQLPVQKGSGCELAKWTIKFNREGLYVDGIRTSDNTPWHSTIIVKRISRDVLRTLSGKTYTLIGPMNIDESSKFPKWLLSKFVHGFPQDWKKHFERFLSETKKNAKGPGPEATENAEKKSSTPFVTPSCPPPSSSVSSLVLKRSRSGRLIKPPLEYWKGGRVIVDKCMNVTILEDYYESSVCMTKSFTLPTISESQPPIQHGGLRQYCREAPQHSQGTGMHLVDQQQSSAVCVLQRKVRAASRNCRAKTHAEPEVSVSPPEEGRRGDASSSPEEQEPTARRAAERRRPVWGAALQVGRSTDRPDPRQRSGDDTSEGRITALLREQNIQASKKLTVAHSAAASPSDEDIPVRRKGRRKAQRQDMHQSVLYDSLSSTSISPLDSSLTVPRKGMGKTVKRTGKGRVRSPELAPDPVSPLAKPSKRGGRHKVPSPVSAPGKGMGKTVKRTGKGRVRSPELAPDPVSPLAKPSKRGGRHKVPSPVSAPAQRSKRRGQRKVPSPVSAPAQRSKRRGQRKVPSPVSAPAQPSKRGDGGTAPKRALLREEEEKEDWTEAELARLKMAMASFPKHMGSYWVNVAMMVQTRSPEDCQTQHNFQASVKASSKNTRVSGKKKEPLADQAPPAITARVGSLQRKQQVWQFMEAMPKEDNDDAFSSSAMQGKRFQMPSMTPSGKEQGFVLSDLEPTTPRGSSYCTVKTPPGLHITPGMIRSVNRKKDDNYIFQLQKRIKRSQVNACKLSPPTKTFTLTSSVKRGLRKGGNMEDTSFVIREMFPDNRGAQDDESGEEDVYFSDSD